MKNRCTGPRSGRVLVLSAVLALSAVFCSTQSYGQAPDFEPAHPGPPTPNYQGPVLVTMFQGKLDTDKAKAGDPVTLKVKSKLKMKNLQIPSGSKVIGKVVSVQSKEAGNGTSALGIQFDKIEMKGNKEMPIRGLIVAIGKISIGGNNGYQDVMGRGGVGSTVGLDPGMAAGHAGVDDVPPGSSLPGVALAKGLDPQQATEMRGFKTDIKLDSSTMVKIELFRANPAS